MKNPIFQRESTTIDFDERDPYIELHSLRTRSHERNKGSATRTMREFLEYADSRGKDVRLYASPLDRRTRIGRLIEFYRALGFEETGKKINALGHPEMVRYRKRNPVDEPLTFRRDHGVSERYIHDKRLQAERDGYRTTSKGTRVPRNFTSTTAYLSRPALFPVAKLEGVPGLEGEETFNRETSLEYLIPYTQRTGQMPLYEKWNGEKEQTFPFINAWVDGKWYVNEGNHRIKVARMLGWKYIPLEIKWYGGGDIQPHRRGFTPEEVLAFDEQAHREGFSVTDFRGTL